MSGYENSREDRERSWMSLTAAVKVLLSENLLTEEQAEDLYQRICSRAGRVRQRKNKGGNRG